MTSAHAQILKYTLLPGFWPRVQDIFRSGFKHIACLIAVIYSGVRLLPPDHPYLNPANFGRYGIRHVVSEAANRLVFSWKNTDQIFVFFLILTGLVLLLAQGALLVAAFMAHPALALSFSDVFGIDENAPYNGGAQDMVFVLLDRVFGLEGIFNSCLSAGVGCTDINGNNVPGGGMPYPYPIHHALHTMLEFYSRGIFIVAVFLLIYFTITIAAETAVSGTPFGQRFNRAWAPLRIIAFSALLLPLNMGGTNEGLNGAQLITFWTAKFGSNFATNAWNRYNDNLSESYLGNPQNLIGTPNIPEIGDLAKFMFLAKTCKIAMGFADENLAMNPVSGQAAIQPYLVRENKPPNDPASDTVYFSTTPFNLALDFSRQGNLTIVFGEYGRPVLIGPPGPNDPPTKYTEYKGYVKPWCGTVTLRINDGTQGSGKDIQAIYYQLIKDMWENPSMAQAAECLVRKEMPFDSEPDCPHRVNQDFARSQIQMYQDYVNTNIPTLIEQHTQNADWSVPDRLKERGWGGAAIWYNRVADLNGQVTAAVFNVPKGTLYPEVMMITAAQKMAADENVKQETLHEPILPDGKQIDFEKPSYFDVAKTLYKAEIFWNESQADTSHFKYKSDNIVLTVINWIFGSSGIFNIYKNPDINPLAQLSTLGKSMMEASLRNIASGSIGNLLISENQFGKALASFANKIGFATLAMSFVLYYVLPFMPFIYFLFGVGGWIKSIFEAIVAVPLWALAHIRIDGEGLPGPAASNGYFLLLEIFLRPILIVFGLIASITIFSALVMVLNDVFGMVVANVGGFNREAAITGSFGIDYDNYRGPMDQLFYTCMYVIICYMMGLGSFKLVDTIPNNILRWMGISVSTFQETDRNAADQVLQQTYQGATMTMNRVRGGALALLLG